MRPGTGLRVVRPACCFPQPPAAGQQAAAAPALAATGQPPDQLVYIQFAGNLSRAQITFLNRQLGQAGWQVQSKSGERTALAANRNEVRYSGTNAAAAAALADAINQAGLTARPVRPVENPGIVTDVLEVWISG